MPWFEWLLLGAAIGCFLGGSLVDTKARRGVLRLLSRLAPKHVRRERARRRDVRKNMALMHVRVDFTLRDDMPSRSRLVKPASFYASQAPRWVRRRVASSLYDLYLNYARSDPLSTMNRWPWKDDG